MNKFDVRGNNSMYINDTERRDIVAFETNG